MPITDAQREQRKKHIGSSDMPAILGVDPWSNAYDVWLDKTGKLTQQDESGPMRIGRLFENGLLMYVQEELGAIRRNVYRSAPDLPIGASIDAVLLERELPVEAKMGTSMHSAEHWGPFETDGVPDRVIVQCQVHMMCMAKEKPEMCYVPHFDPWHGLGMYIIPRNEALMRMIADQAVAFWQNHVEANVAPIGTPHLPVIKRMIREPGKIKELTEQEVEKIETWQQLRTRASKARDAVEKQQVEILTLLGDAEGSQVIPGFGQITYLEQKRMDLDKKKIMHDEPKLYTELCEKYETEKKFRVLRFKKPPKQKTVA